MKLTGITITITFVFFSVIGNAQTDSGIDSLCVFIYEGMRSFPPPPPPSIEDDSIDIEIKTNKYYKEIEKEIGVDTMREFNFHTTPTLIDSNGKYNPTIIWASKKCLNKQDSEFIVDILKCKTNRNDSDVPLECFYPRHGIILFDSKNKLIESFSICFECSHTMQISIREHKKCINHFLLKEEFKKIGIPIFKNHEEFLKYKSEN